MQPHHGAAAARTDLDQVAELIGHPQAVPAVAAGLRAVEITAAAVSAALNMPLETVFLASTGVIGEPLPVQKIVAAMSTLKGGLASGHFDDAARAIIN